MNCLREHIDHTRFGTSIYFVLPFIFIISATKRGVGSGLVTTNIFRTSLTNVLNITISNMHVYISTSMNAWMAEWMNG